MKRALTVCSLGLALAIGIYLAWLGVPRHDWFVERTGVLDSVQASQFETDGIVHESVALEGSTGLAVDLRVNRPAAGGLGQGHDFAVAIACRCCS